MIFSAADRKAGWCVDPHALWDTGILQTESGTARAMAKRLDEEFSSDDRKAWEAGTPTDWANESLALTIEYVYPLPESHKISMAYVQRALPILNKRLEQAGVRLAWLLNEAPVMQKLREDTL